MTHQQVRVLSIVKKSTFVFLADDFDDQKRETDCYRDDENNDHDVGED